MYNIDFYNLGEKIRKIRKAKKISIKEFANKIGKSENTVYKYERNEIMPDHKTVLEICNVLEVSHDDLIEVEKIEENKETSNNPFPVNELYIYYIGFKRMAEFKLEIHAENGFQKVYFINPKSRDIFFVGTIEANQEIAFISMKNYYAINKRFEKVLIMINLQYSSDNKNMGILIGTKEDVYTPVIKKCILLKHRLETEEDKNKTFERLKLTNEELKQIEKDNFWYPNYSNESDFESV